MTLICICGVLQMLIVSVSNFIANFFTATNLYIDWFFIVVSIVTKKNQWIDTHHMVSILREPDQNDLILVIFNILIGTQVLYGHRSIVNQVRYNPQKCILASSGVEKVVKVWRPFESQSWTGSLTEDGPTNTRDIFSQEEYLSLYNSSQSNVHEDYSLQNTTEDPRMMACKWLPFHFCGLFIRGFEFFFSIYSSSSL